MSFPLNDFSISTNIVPKASKIDPRKKVQAMFRMEKRHEKDLRLLLFNLILENTIRKSQLNKERHPMCKSHQFICYAYDMAMIGRTEDYLKAITKRLAGVV